MGESPEQAGDLGAAPDGVCGRAGRLPDFLIIGAMKAGTTTLYEYLRRDPRIYMPPRGDKEPGFFSRDHIYERGFAWYRRLFAEAETGQLCGEASTCYSRWPSFPDAPERIADALPNVRLIYILRHPVERAYSHYVHVMRTRVRKNWGPVISLEEAIEQIPEIEHGSRYADQIERFMRYFSASRLLILRFEQLVREPEASLARAQRHLGLDPRDLTADGPVAANRTKDQMDRDEWTPIFQKMRRSWLGESVAGLMPKRTRRGLGLWLRQARLGAWVGSALGGRLKRISELTPERRRWLLERFEEPTRRLERWMGRSFPEWHE